MLNAHPQVAIAPETFFMRRFWLKRGEYGDLTDDGAFEHLVEAMAAAEWFSLMGLSRHEFRLAAAGAARTVPAVFAQLLGLFAAENEARLVGEKTPNHVLYMRELQVLFPSCLFVHIVRDPRAVASSRRSVPWSTGTLRGDAGVWRKWLSTARKRPPRAGSVHTVSFERLVSETEGALTDLCAFLGIEYSAAMLDHHELPPDDVDVAREPWKAAALDPTNAASAERWRSDLDHDAVAEIERAAWPEMTRWGYERVTSILNVGPPAVWLGAKRVLRAVKRSIRRKIT